MHACQISQAPDGDQAVRCVYFDTPLHPGNLTLAEMSDGSLRVLMNDRPVDDCHFPPGAIHDAVDKFQAIKASLRTTHAPRPASPVN